MASIFAGKSFHTTFSLQYNMGHPFSNLQNVLAIFPAFPNKFLAAFPASTRYQFPSYYHMF